MNRRETSVVDRLDLKRGQRGAIRKARMVTHAREALAVVAQDLAPITDEEDRVMRLKAGLAAHAQALERLIGAASLVAFVGSIAGHHGEDLKANRRAK
jgi:hypothetical protein